MNNDKTKDALFRANFCLANKVPIDLNTPDLHGTYIPLYLIKRYDNKKQPVYEVCLRDAKQVKSNIIVGINDVEWPTAGGGFICKE